MTRLRMKQSTAEDIESILKAERRARRRRRREEERHRKDDSMTPPRASSSRVPMTDDIGYDESSVPPAQARKGYSYGAEEGFEDRLRDALEMDQGVGFQEEMLYSRESTRKTVEAAAFSYGGAAGVALGMGTSGLGALDEEEYAEYVRAGMWRMKNKEEVERQEAIDRARKIKEEKELKDTEARKKVEREKIRLLEERAKRRGEKEEQEARERYEDTWKRILVVPVPVAPPPPPPPIPPPPPSTSTPPPDNDASPGPQPAPPHPNPLRFTDFPWPLYPPAPFPPLSWPSPSDITATSITTFLLSHLAPAAKKPRLRAAVLAYHPDRFERLVGRVGKEETRERVRELGLRVSQVLNDLLKAGGGAAS